MTITPVSALMRSRRPTPRFPGRPPIPGRPTFPGRPISAMTALAFGLILAACQTAPVQDDELSQIAGAKEALERPDPTFIVDCLLPGKIKKMGTSFTYLTPRRPVKISSQDCEIRGGEYVAYDRANYATALRVWLPMAEQGDMVAQTYVGAIFEKGLGVAPDYTKAAQWYQKAADQGYAQAQFALGYMYETGQGVERNPANAFRLYRMAAGLPEEDVPASAVLLSEVEKQKLAEQTAAEEALLEKVADEVSVKQQELSAMQQQLASAKASLEAQEAQFKTQAALTAQARADARQYKRDVEKGQQQVKDIDAQLAAKRELLVAEETKLQQQAALARQHGDELKDLIERISTRKNELAAELTTLNAAASNLATRSQQSPGAAEQTQWAAEQSALQAQLAQKQQQLDETNQALIRQQTLAAEKGRELNSLVAQVEQRKQSLRQELAALDQSRAQAQLQQASLSEGVSQELEQKQAELTKQRELIAELEKQAKENTEKLAYLQQAQNKDKLALLVPKIEIIDPQLPVVRSVSAVNAAPVFSVTEGVSERPIVGRVTAAEQLMLVTVNDQRVSLSDKGVFNTSLKILPTATLVNIVAVDNSGNRGETQFVLAPASQPRALPGQASTGVVATAVGKLELPDIEFGGYHALLIGNNEYKHLPKLLTPIKDAEEIARVLKNKYGFKSTTVLKNATRYDVITAMNKLRKQLTSEDNLVVYYAGHGELDRVNMSGQWLPVDAEPENSANWISNSSLTELINAIPAKHVMLVADSCYSGILTRSALTNLQQSDQDDSRLNWIKKMVKKRSRTVLTSGGVAPVLDEGGGEHSIFARAFLTSLETNNEVLEGQRLFRQVSAAVSIAADRYQVEQVPEYAPIRHAGHESGDFFFVPQRSGI